MTTAFFFGALCGASIVGLFAYARICELKQMLGRARQDTINQVNNTLALVDSIEAQYDRERYRDGVETDWEGLFTKVRGVK